MTKEFRERSGFNSVHITGFPFLRRLGFLLKGELYIGVQFCDGVKVRIRQAVPIVENGDLRVIVEQDTEE